MLAFFYRYPPDYFNAGIFLHYLCAELTETDLKALVRLASKAKATWIRELFGRRLKAYIKRRFLELSWMAQYAKHLDSFLDGSIDKIYQFYLQVTDGGLVVHADGECKDSLPNEGQCIENAPQGSVLGQTLSCGSGKTSPTDELVPAILENDKADQALAKGEKMEHFYGNKNTFAIAYELEDPDLTGVPIASIRAWAGGMSITNFCKDNEPSECYFFIENFVEWFQKNLSHILNEEGFPLPVDADSSVAFWNASCPDIDEDDDSDIDEETDQLLDIREAWFWRHNWAVEQGPFFIPDVFFRSVGDRIEINWHSKYPPEDGNIEFEHPTGVFYVDKDEFEQTITSFLQGFTLV